jgi:hypothetical protein
MRSTTILSTLIAAVAAMVMILAAPSAAQAQPQNLTCCTFTIDVNLPPACFGAFPITIVTDWCPTGPFTYTMPGNGIFILPLANCPPFAPYFLSTTIPGGPSVTLGGAGTVILGGCPVTYAASTDAAGCIYITIR